jgi:molecular chaperone HscB
VSIAQDHFSLFGLAPRFALDLDALDAAYKRIQAQVHPDRFAAGSPAERRVAMQWATRANEAFRTLRSPLSRAIYLCETHGAPIEAETNTAMPAEFLSQQLEWREALDDARGDPPALQALADEVDAAHAHTEARIAAALDARHDYTAAAVLVRQLMFIERLRGELSAAADAHSTTD